MAVVDAVAEHIENDRLLVTTIEGQAELIAILEAERDADFARAERAEADRDAWKKRAEWAEAVLRDMRS